MPSPRRNLALLHIIKFVTNQTPFVGDDARIVPHNGPCRIFYPVTPPQGGGRTLCAPTNKISVHHEKCGVRSNICLFHRRDEGIPPYYRSFLTTNDPNIS